MSCSRREKNAEHGPQYHIVNAGDSEREMANTTAEQAHLAQNRSENRERIHTDANPDRGDELDRTDAGEEFAWMARQNPTASQTTKGHRNGDIRYRYGPKRPFIATENAGV